MTSTQPDADSAAAEQAQTFLDWTRINGVGLGIAAAALAVIAFGYWFYERNQQIKEQNAERMLMNAKQSMASGNLPLARSDLDTAYARYGSTPAGAEAVLLLAQIDFDTGKYQDGVNRLEKLSGTGPGSKVQATIYGLEGDGLAQMNKLADAAKEYEKAANATTFETERAFLRAKAARTYQDAGDAAKARQLWTELANDPKSQTVAAEAKVRLGELSAQVAKK